MATAFLYTAVPLSRPLKNGTTFCSGQNLGVIFDFFFPIIFI